MSENKDFNVAWAEFKEELLNVLSPVFIPIVEFLSKVLKRL